MLLPKINFTPLLKPLLVIILALSLLVRVWQIDSTPPSLYWDEMDVGYQAYSILKTGKDYYGNNPFLVVHSFADFRAPVLIYLTVPFVAIFGLTPLAVRVPEALLGTLSVLLIYILTRQLFKSQKAALLAALLTAFAPWNIQYSRIAYEAMLMLVVFLTGLIFFYKGLLKSKYLIISAILVSLDLFVYNTMKLFIPFIAVSLIAIYYKQLTLNRSSIIASIILSISLTAGLYGTIFMNGGQRFNEISIFTDPQNSKQVDYLRHNSQLSYNDQPSIGETPRFFDKLFYNKPALFIDRITQNYLTAFSSEFLFVKGDTNLRHSTTIVGELYRIEALAIILGLGFLLINLKKNPRESLLIIIWVIIAPLAAIITREGSNHATRLFMLFPALTIVGALGVEYLSQILPPKLRFLILTILFVVWLFCVGSFLNFYFGAYNLESAKSFQFGFDQAVQKATENKNSYDYVIIDDRTDSALMNYLFLTKHDPALFHTQISTLKSDIAGFPGDQIDNVILMKPLMKNWDNAFSINQFNHKYLLIVSAEQMSEQTPEKLYKKLTPNQTLIETIYYKSGLPAFYVISSQKPSQI